MFKKTDAYLVGYYGMKNSGDDALMYATAWGAKHYLDIKETTLGLLASHTRHNPADKQVNLNFNQAFPGQNRLSHYKMALQSRRIVFGGGSVLHTESDINLKRHLMSLSSRKNSRAVGVSLGPFQNMAAEIACAKFLDECGFIGVRDNKSFEIAKSLSPQANVVKTFDLAPSLLSTPQYKINDGSRNGVALALCPIATTPMGNTNDEAEQQRISDICEMLVSFYNNTGESITLLSFNGHEALGDWSVNKPIMDKLSTIIPITIKAYNPDPYAVLNDLSSYKAIISMRLHGSILGYMAETPVISLNYHEKCKGWCEQIGLAKSYQVDLEKACISDILSPLVNGLDYGFTQPTMAIKEASKLSLSNWSINHE